MRLKQTYFTPGIHILVWVLFFIITAVLFSGVKMETGLPQGFFLYTNLLHIALFYFNAYILFPRLVTRKWWWLYVLATPAIIALLFALKVWGLQLADTNFTLTDVNRRIIFFPPVPFIIAGIILQVIKRRINADKLQKEQHAERLATELKFLRNQVSPHFLFNMMTNMVALARQKSDLLEPSLIKLSELLRYMLYSADEDTFTVGDEITYLTNYIELQGLRFGDDADVQLDIQNNEPGCFIEPMLLIPFVENAFKHGIGLVHNPFIKIIITVNNRQLHFTVINNYNRYNIAKDKGSGIGLQNVKNRLRLLYPGNYDLNIKDNGEIFKAHLKLTLAC